MVQQFKEVGPQRYRETFGRYYEDFHVGDVYEHQPGKTVTEYDNHLFTLMTMNTHPMHFDAEFAKASEFKKNIVVSPYTLALLRSRAHGAMERVDGKRPRLETIAGSPPDLSLPQTGCAFAPRCNLANDACKQSQPDATTISNGHSARCLRLDATE